jgi:hypothetical protein
VIGLEEMLPIITCRLCPKRGKTGIFALERLEYRQDFRAWKHAIFDGKYMDLP